MKEKILKLRNEGKTYDEIKAILGCSKGTISYHCGPGQKKKNLQRKRKLRKENTLLQKCDNFKSKKGIRNKAHHFLAPTKGAKQAPKLSEVKHTFTYHDVLAQLNDPPTCYLTGREFDISDPKAYNFDHIVPASKGGDNSLSNLGVTCREANSAKGDLLHDEFIELCKDVLEHHGYKVVPAREIESLLRG